MLKRPNHPVFIACLHSCWPLIRLNTLICRKLPAANLRLRGKIALAACICCLAACSNPPKQALEPTAFEKSGGKATETYESGIAYWREMAEYSDYLSVIEYGFTDANLPLHLAVLSPSKEFDAQLLQASGKTIVLVNNAIHPGEPDGVDASILLCKELIESETVEEELGNVVLVFIPFYNIGGALNRNSTTRANQQGPESYGFRGNAQNYDLNRDFIKSDTKNAGAFAMLFNEWSPDVFIDTHVSNGADYQYNITCLDTQPDKLGGKLGDYLREKFTPALFEYMQEQGEPMTPYVNVWGSIPDSGWVQFMDHPRYSTGYAALHHSIGFMTETHMLKPFDKRVRATKRFLEGVLAYAKEHGEKIRELRKQAVASSQKAEKWPIAWKNNPEVWDTISFKGYEASYPASKVTGLPRLYYDRDKPFEKDVRLFNRFEPETVVSVPKAYIIPQSWDGVIQRLQWNGVELDRLDRDTTLEVAVYHIDRVATSSSPYEGHYPHREVEVSKKPAEVSFRKGDYWVSTEQEKRRFLIEVLEPEAVDSYFRWNFFDIILQRKEGFSPYVFEQEAAEMLASDPELRGKFEEKRSQDTAFAQSAYAQLRYLYEHSPHSEQAYRQYPVYRVE